MKTLIVSSILSLALVAGCSKKKGSQCEQIFDHTVSLMPANMQGKVKANKTKALAKCEKLSPEAKKCALAAKSLADLMKCPRS